MSRLLSIQYLRAIAALMVVAYHAMRWVEPGFSIGAAGVDIFFIISGFILWTIASERPVTPAVFLHRRLIRVAPLYWVLTLVVSACALAWPRLFWDAKPTLSHVLLSLAFIQHLNADGQPFPIITAGWSLNYEAAFYLIFAACLIVPRKHRIWALTVALAAVPFTGIFIYQPGYFLGANMMFLQFIAGVWLAELRLTGRLPERRTGWIMATMGVAMFGLLYGLSLYNDLWRPFIWGVPALLIVSGAVSVEAQGGMADIRWLRFLGDASYSIYLAHFLAIELVSDVMHTNRWSFVPVAITIAIAAGVGCYWAFERPMIALMRPRRLAVLPCEAT